MYKSIVGVSIMGVAIAVIMKSIVGEQPIYLDNILAVFAVIVTLGAVLLSTRGLPRDRSPKINELLVEPGYLILRRHDNYSMIVGRETYEKAKRLHGEYIPIGPTDRSVPVGQKYTDERLN